MPKQNRRSGRSGIARRSRAVTFVPATVTIAAGLWFGVVAGKPALLAARKHAENDALEHRLLLERKANQDMSNEVRALTTPQGVAVAARKFGWVPPGQQKLHIPRD